MNLPGQLEPAALCSVRDKVVVVTGCTGVLGRRYCEVLSALGARLVMADLSARAPLAAAAQLAADTGHDATGVDCDVTSESDVRALFAHAEATFGRVDVVVNNAAATGEHLLRAGAVFAAFEEYPLDVWNEVLRTNLTGVFLVARAAGPCFHRAGGGSLINIGSIYGVRGPDHRLYLDMPFASFAAYSASKAGVHGITMWLATYWARQGIRVNTVAPGGIYNGHDPEFVRRYADRTPMARMGTPDDISGIIIYLASDASRYCTGQQFVLDGGISAW